MTNEICGDITKEHRLTNQEKWRYLFGNLWRGLYGYLTPLRIKFWWVPRVESGSDSPGRSYLNTYLDHVLPRLIPPGSINMLDLGCGTGYVRERFAALGYTGTYTGVDIQREPTFDTYDTLAFTSHFIKESASIFSEQNRYDLVLSNTALEHIPDDRAAACAAYKALRSGGIGLHIMPSFWSLFLYLFHGYRQYSPKRIKYVFRGMLFRTYRLGGFASFVLHFIIITFAERILGIRGLRERPWYSRTASIAARIDRFLPFCSATYVVIVRKEIDAEPCKKRILFALPSLLAAGGIERQLAQQLTRYDRNRFTLAVLTLFSYGERETVNIPDDVMHMPVTFSGKLNVKGWLRLVSYLRMYDPDVVVTSMFSANTALRLLKPFFRYCVIAREHNTYEEKNSLQRFIDHVLSRMSCRIVAVSEGVADFAAHQARIPRSRFTVIQNGIDLEAVSEWNAQNPNRGAIRTQLGINADEEMFLTVGRLKKTKNQEMLIRAFSEFVSSNPQARLIIIGDGSEKPTYEELIEKIGYGRIQLIQRFGKEVWPYYAAADFFILPSLREGFPNVILEAMAFKLPVLATPVSGTKECLREGENGFFFSPTEGSICTALEKASGLSQYERASFSNEAYAQVKHFSLTRTVSRYEEIFITCAP